MWQGQTWATGKGTSSPSNVYPYIITSLTVGHMYSHVTDWVTKCGQVPREFELATYQSEFDALTNQTIRNTK